LSPTRAPTDRQAATAAMIAQFRDALRELRCMGSQRLLQRGVSMSHLYLMSMLERHGELPMSRIAELLDVSLSNATGLIDRMEERGLAERVRVSDDRRVVHVRVTDSGRRALADVEVLQDEALARVLGKLDDRQLGRLAVAVTDLQAALLAVTAEEPDLFAHHHPAHGEHPDARSAGSPTHRT